MPLFEGGSETIASYDFKDITSGISFEKYYAGIGISTGYIRTVTFSSDVVVTLSAITAGTNLVVVIDKDFDIPIKKSTIIDGMALTNATIGMKNVEGTSNPTCRAIVFISKVSGGVEKQLISGTSNILDEGSVAVNTTNSGIVCVDTDIPREKFKKGDTLRLTVRVEGNSDNLNTYYGLGHDPSDRNDLDNAHKTIEDAHTTVLTVQLPFKVDL